MVEQIKQLPQTMEEKHAVWREHLREMAGDEDIRGMEISSAIRMLANFYESAISQNDTFSELSSSRLGILIRLMGEKHFGNPEGINPTQISKLRNVSKNTISALLRGLEDQGLIERTLDPTDKRRFLIRITPAGEEMVHATAPARVQFMNQLVSDLSVEQQDQLLSLLDQLRQSLLSSGCLADWHKEQDAKSE